MVVERTGNLGSGRNGEPTAHRRPQPLVLELRAYGPSYFAEVVLRAFA